MGAKAHSTARRDGSKRSSAADVERGGGQVAARQELAERAARRPGRARRSRTRSPAGSATERVKIESGISPISTPLDPRRSEDPVKRDVCTQAATVR